ncbi:RHS repeat domain-containing protein [Vibrio aestuarianus]|uniref:RHS repeat domain-containing protein n=1 Tax=Vibrio aestuarianus TaxID=28171 RepID=UPI00237CCC67|nr:RHS repeat protein [Vibrio aestuarianus]MDE1263094.1 RHS repeat protein [Vibrio aestuarianus]MDE1297235.1 RHS repeat protein [Vibrio aestuarianus]
MQESILSNAQNFAENLSSGVDVRTGSFSVGINIGEFISHKTSGPIISLNLSYAASSGVDIGFGGGWSLPLSSFNKESNMLYLYNGQSFKLTWNSSKGEYDIVYKKLKDVRVFYIGETHEIKVEYKDGRTDYIDYETGLHSRAVSSTGLEVNFQFTDYGLNKVLWHAYDNAGRKLVIDTWTNPYKTTVEHLVDDRVIQTIEFEKHTVNHFTYLDQVIFPSMTQPIQFQYRYLTSSGYRVIEEVTHSSGLVERLTYAEVGHRLPDSAPLESVPYVSEHTIYPGEGQFDQYTKYEFTTLNYLGYNCGIAWVAGEDTLFKADGDYRYQTTEIINQTKKVVREYNKYHLLESAEYYSDNKLHRKEEYAYFADLNQRIEDQSAKYSLVKEQKITHYNQSKSRLSITQYDYDDYGNLTLERNNDGSEVTRTYYPVEGEGTQCPASPNGIVSYLKEEVFYPASSDFGEHSRSKTITYTSLPRLDNTAQSFVLLNSIYEEGQLISYSYYDDPSNVYKYGRVKSETMTFNQFTDVVNFEYEYLDEGVKTISRGLTHDGIASSTSLTVDYFFGKKIENVNENGVVERTQYDSLGRILKVELSPATENTANSTFNYDVGDGNNKLTQTDSKGNVTVNCMNNAGNVIQVKQLYGGELFPVQEFTYDQFGLMRQKIDIDYVEGVEYRVSTDFTYDSNGQVHTIDHQDGRKELIEQDPVSLTTTYQQLGLVVESTTYNELGQVTTKQTLDDVGNLIAHTNYSYDGYGNLRRIVDTDDRTIEYRYDRFDRVEETVRVIDGETITESYSYPEFTSSDVVSQVLINNKEVGTRSYDGLLRIKTETSAGVTQGYSYTGTMSVPSSIHKASGDLIKISSNRYLDKPESAVVEGMPNLSTNYRYDNQTGLPLYALGQGGELNIRRDSFGRICSESVVLNDGISRSTEYQYSLQGRLVQRSDFFGNITRFSYDPFGRLSTISEQTANQSNTTVIEYDQYSRAYKYTMNDGKNVVCVELAFDSKGLEISRLATVNGNQEFLYQQQYNKNLLLERRIYTDGNGSTTETYFYDGFNRLVEYICNGPNNPHDSHGNMILRQEFQYDIFGNILKLVSEFSDGSKNVSTYTYDSEIIAKLKKITNTHADYASEVNFQYDGSGNMLNDEQGRQYSYNELDQLVSVNENSGQELTRYQYDALGQVVSQTIEEQLLYLLYSQGELSNETSNGVSTHYNKITEGLIRRQISNGNDNHQDILLGNGQGSIVETLSENSEGTIVDKKTHSYTPYGDTD